MAARKAPGNQWSDKAWRDAIRLAVMRAHEDPKKGKKLAALADALVDAGLDGDVPALKEIGDRLDGKVAQALEHSGPAGSAIPLQMIELRPVAPK